MCLSIAFEHGSSLRRYSLVNLRNDYVSVGTAPDLSLVRDGGYTAEIREERRLM
jgi:hypothetical protein